MHRDDIMIDLETGSATRNGSITGPVLANGVIFEIGAVVFNPFEETPEEVLRENSFQVNISKDKQPGRETTPDTIKWWEGQDPDVYRAVTSGTKSLGRAVSELTDFMSTRLNKHSRVWFKGAIFDFTILSDAVYSVGEDLGIPFWNIMCMRGCLDLIFGGNPKREMFAYGDAHSAIDDCITQIRIMQRCYSDTEEIRRRNRQEIKDYDNKKSQKS